MLVRNKFFRHVVCEEIFFKVVEVLFSQDAMGSRFLVKDEGDNE